jgi:agmatinase
MTGRVALLGLPYDENSSFLRGCAEAPPTIRAALFSDASHLTSETGRDLAIGPALIDEGDVALTSGAAARREIERAVAAVLERGLAPVSLGGDHAVTYPILRAVARMHPKLAVLQFDAHPDLYEVYDDNRFSHACPFARILEERLASRLVQVGIRTMNAHQRAQAERFGVEVIEMRHWRDDLVLEFDAPVYVSFDIDALDPAFAPGVSHREPGGLSTRQALRILQTVRGNVIGGDVVEYNPRADSLGVTAVVCAKLVKELASKILDSGGTKAPLGPT